MINAAVLNIIKISSITRERITAKYEKCFFQTILFEERGTRILNHHFKDLEPMLGPAVHCSVGYNLFMIQKCLLFYHRYLKFLTMGDLDESPLRDQSPVADELAEEIAVLRIDEKEAESKEDTHQSDNVDKTDDNEVKMAVKIRNRTPSSIDTDYQDLINKYGNEEYLSKIDITSDKAAEDEEARSL